MLDRDAAEMTGVLCTGTFERVLSLLPETGALRVGLSGEWYPPRTIPEKH